MEPNFQIVSGIQMLRRLHFFEFEDLDWIPPTIRDGVTDFLEFAVVKTPLYDGIAPLLSDSISRSRANRVVDLCSGGGGAWSRLYETCLPSGLNVTLTDLYPNQAAFERAATASADRVTGRVESVDATRVDDSLPGFRTLFSSFHHFRPEGARAVLVDAVESGSPIAVFESTQRHLLLLLYMLFVPVIVLLVTPFIRPFRLSRLVFTYLLPIIPLMVAFDGFVSCLRTYTVEELESMVASLPSNDFDWQVGLSRIGSLPVGVTYLIGSPRQAEGDSCNRVTDAVA
ncbi:MAG: class I SAM-dependent methyltransferase [Pseudomonadota bacterium]